MQHGNGGQHANAERQHRDVLLGLAAEFLAYVGGALEGDGGDPQAIRKMQVTVYRLWRCERRKFALQYLNAPLAEDAAYREKCKLYDGPGAVRRLQMRRSGVRSWRRFICWPAPECWQAGMKRHEEQLRAQTGSRFVIPQRGKAG
jgi:hypothetical protein